MNVVLSRIRMASTSIFCIQRAGYSREYTSFYATFFFCYLNKNHQQRASNAIILQLSLFPPSYLEIIAKYQPWRFFFNRKYCSSSQLHPASYLALRMIPTIPNCSTSHKNSDKTPFKLHFWYCSHRFCMVLRTT